jgi:DNA-directed RNA polymerase subunit RPC12/RpoP
LLGIPVEQSARSHYRSEGDMAEPSDGKVSRVPPSTVDCPSCGSRVTAVPSTAGEKGSAFRCPECDTLFGIVPGIAEPEEGSSKPP